MDWQSDLKKESIDNSVKAGDILPQLRIDKPGDTVKVMILTEPTMPEGRDFYVMDVEILESGAKNYMYVGKSLRFSLAVEMKKHNLEEVKQHVFILGKTTADMSKKGFSKETEVYYAQLVE